MDLLDELILVGDLIRERRSDLQQLVDRRQELVVKLRGEGFTLAECARAAGVNPEAINNLNRRREAKNGL